MKVSRACRVIALALAVLLFLTCSGCWDRREVDRLNIAMLIGVDRVVKDGKPLVLYSALSLKANAMPLGASGAGVGTSAALGFVDSAEGENISDASRNLAVRSPRSLSLGHVQAIVIGEGMARDGIQDVIDYADRSKELRYRVDVVTCHGSALEALEAQPEFEMLASTEIQRIIRTSSARISKTIPADLFHVVYGLMTPGKDVAMPKLDLFTPPERGSSVRKGPPSGQSGGGDQQDHQGKTGAQDQNFNQELGVEESKHPERKTMKVDGTAVYSGDKLAGWLNGDESLGAMFITKQAAGGEIPFAFRSSENNSSYVFRRVKTSLKPVINQDGITIQVKIRGVGRLTEDKDAAIDMTKEADLKAAEQLVDVEAQHYCQEAVARCQLLNSDIFGFGDLIHKSDPAFWKQVGDRWRDYFPAVKVQVQADFTIEQTGLTGEAIRAK